MLYKINEIDIFTHWGLSCTDIIPLIPPEISDDLHSFVYIMYIELRYSLLSLIRIDEYENFEIE